MMNTLYHLVDNLKSHMFNVMVAFFDDYKFAFLLSTGTLRFVNACRLSALLWLKWDPYVCLNAILTLDRSILME